eukprot:9757443-Ditylum_brightwellii.AAC.1
MLSNIMSKCKKQHYDKSVRNINSSNDKKQRGNNDGNHRTYIMSTVWDKNIIAGMAQGRKKINYCASKQSLRK